MATDTSSSQEAPSTAAMDRLKTASGDMLKALGDRAISNATDRVGGLTDRLDDIAAGGPIKKAVVKGGEAAAKGESPVAGGLKGAVSGVKDKVTGRGKGGGGKGGKATKATNIIESIDVGVPVRVAYNQWTEFGEFPTFMKKVHAVEAEEDTKINWKAQIFWSHRRWEATILEQIPDERIVWRSKGEKGHVDGAVTFHPYGKDLTRILMVLEYYPQGFMERTGNIWRAQGRRARAELRNFRRHVMTRTILQPEEEVEGWRGRIEDGELVQTHEEALEEEQRAAGDEGEPGEEPEEREGEPEGEYEEEEEYEEEPEGEYEEEEEEEEPEDEYEEEEEEEPDYEEEEEEEPEDEYEEEEEEEEPEERPRRSRRRAS